MGESMPQKIEMQDNNLLVKKIDQANKSQFEMAGEADKRGAIFEVCHAPKDSKYQAGDTVLLKPETYPGFYYAEELFTYVIEEDVIAKLVEG